MTAYAAKAGTAPAAGMRRSKRTLIAIGSLAGILVAVAAALLSRGGGHATQATPNATVASGTSTAGVITTPITQEAGTTSAIRDYVDKIDGLLMDSAQTRADLGSLIEQVQNMSIPQADAANRIAAIIQQRKDLESTAASVSSPSSFASASDLLVSSITAALNDDVAIQAWIDAWYAGDTTTADDLWARHEAASDRASQAKEAFLSEYNGLRARFLNLPPLEVRY